MAKNGTGEVGSGQNPGEQVLLACKGATAGGSLFKTLKLVKTSAGLTTKASQLDAEEAEVKILSIRSTPVSSQYELETNVGSKVTLVVNEKQAVILYESNDSDDPEDKMPASIEFLKCK